MSLCFYASTLSNNCGCNLYVRYYIWFLLTSKALEQNIRGHPKYPIIPGNDVTIYNYYLQLRTVLMWIHYIWFLLTVRINISGHRKYPNIPYNDVSHLQFTVAYSSNVNTGQDLDHVVFYVKLWAYTTTVLGKMRSVLACIRRKPDLENRILCQSIALHSRCSVQCRPWLPAVSLFVSS